MKSITNIQLKYFCYFSFLLIAGSVVTIVFDQKGWLLFSLAVLLCFLIAHQPIAIFYILIASIPWSVEFTVADSLAIDLPDEPLMLLVMFSTIAFSFFNRIKIKFRKIFSHLVLLLLLQFVWIGISVLFSTNLLVSYKFLLAKSWYLFAFVIAPLSLLNDRKKILATVLIFCFSMIVCTMVALYRHALQGFTFGSINESVLPFFRNHVIYSALLICALPIVLVFMKVVSKKQTLFLFIIFFILIVATYFSYARGAWLAVFIGIISFWLLKKRLLVYAYVLSIVVMLTAVIWLKKDDRYIKYAHDYNNTIFHNNFKEHLIATYQLKDVSTAERFYRWIAGVRIVKDHWQTGTGPATFYPFYQGYTIGAFKTWVSRNDDHSTVHNYFLLTLIEQGIIGLLLLLFLIGYFFHSAQRIYRKTNDIFWKRTVGVVAVILSMICSVNLLSDLIETDKIGSVFYLCIAVLLIADIQTRKELNSSTNIEGIPQPIPQ